MPTLHDGLEFKGFDESCKLSCTAVHQPVVGWRQSEQQVRLGQRAWLLRDPPFDLDTTWREWLGAVRTEEYQSARLFLVVTLPWDNHAGLDRGNASVDFQATCLLYALVITGAVRFGSGIILHGGASESGQVVVKRLSSLHPKYANTYFRTPGLRECVPLVVLLWEGIQKYFRATEAQDDPEIEHHARLRRGFQSLIRGLSEEYAAEAIHEFVRAMEAVVMPAVGRARRDFVHRCGLLASGNANARAILSELFDLRSATEHLNPIDELLSRYDDPEVTARTRRYQAERLACEAYTRLFIDEGMTAHYKTDEQARSFWGRPDHELVSEWGTVVDLAELERTLI